MIVHGEERFHKVLLPDSLESNFLINGKHGLLQDQFSLVKFEGPTFLAASGSVFPEWSPSDRSRRLPQITRPPGTAYSRRFAFTVARKRFPPLAEPGDAKARDCWRTISDILEMREFFELAVPAFDLLIIEAPEPFEAEGFHVQ